VSDRETLRSVLDLFARTEGVEEGEVFLEDSAATSIHVEGGAVESLESRREHGVSVRVFADRRVGFAYTTETSEESLRRMVEEARDLASRARQEEANRPPEPVDPGETAANEDPGLEATPLPARIDLARSVESAARGTDPAVDRVRRASYRDYRGTVRLANTRGLEQGYSFTRALCSVEVAARRNGDNQVGWHAGWALGPSGLDPEEVGTRAARKALDKLGSEPGATRRCAVVLDPETTAGLFEALSSLFSAARVLKKKSLLAERVGDRVASKAVTLIDDGRRPGAWDLAPVDGEGVPTGEHRLLEEGVLRTFLHDTYTAGRMGAASTGNSQRGGYDHPPRIGTTNLFLKPSGPGRGELLRRASGGLYVSEVMGLHTVDPISGDFSVGAAGRLVEPGGALGAPVNQLAIAGNVLDLLRSVEAVADDLTFYAGGAGGATTLLGDLMISGI
jgi:PmbA protein